MKSLKLLVSVATVCLLVGVSGTAMAVDCDSGVIENTTVDNITINGKSCLIKDVVVEGDLTSIYGEEVAVIDGSVGGRVQLVGGRDATMVGVTVTGNILVRNNERALVALNIARNIRIINNGRAVVKRNGAAIAIVCRGNGRLDSFENEAPEVQCRALGGGF